MNKGCDKMRYGACQFYKENIAGKLWQDGAKTTHGPWEYSTYCSSFDNFEKCPYYSYKNFNNQQIRDQYKKNQDANGMASLIVLVVIIVLVLKGCGVF